MWGSREKIGHRPASLVKIATVKMFPLCCQDLICITIIPISERGHSLWDQCLKLRTYEQLKHNQIHMNAACRVVALSKN